MTRDAFEQLVDAWLAEPQRSDLKAQLDAALRAEPRWAALLDEWLRFDQLLRHGPAKPERIDWGRLKTRIGAAVQRDADAQDELLDVALRATPAVDERVHWPRFHARVLAAVTRSVGWGTDRRSVPHADAASRRRRYTRVVVSAATLLAAAAALLLAFLPRNIQPSAPRSVLRVGVSAPRAAAVGVAYVHIAGGSVAAAPPERLFDIDPLPPTAPLDETAGYY